MPDHHSEIDSQSHEMNEIIGKVPSWIIRWGLTLLFGVASIGIFISNMIDFPDTMTAEVLVQAKQQPGNVSLKRDDASQEFIFMVVDDDTVEPGDTLFIHKNDRKGIYNPITTPMAGKVYISKGIDKDNTQEYMVWVVPEVKDFEIKLFFPVKGSGKIKEGQEVIIRLDDFPEADFGFLKGTITKILPMAMNDKYQAFVTLNSEKLITHLGEELPLHHVLSGTGEIILENKTIAQRIFGSIKF